MATRKRPRLPEIGSTVFLPDDTLPDDVEPRWPSKINELRPVNVSITTWEGIAPGASHYSILVDEAPQQWWSEEHNCWAEIAGVLEIGFRLQAAVQSEALALAVAETFLDMVLRDDPWRRKHGVVWKSEIRPKGARRR